MEEHSPEGIGSYAAIISDRDDELNRKMIAFLEGIGYRGFANFDIKLDPRDGQYKLFEMNLRQGRSSFFVTAAGYNLAKWLADDVVYEKNMELTVADNQVLWTIIPKKIIMTYVKDEGLKAEAKRLYKEGKVCRSLLYKPDMNPPPLDAVFPGISSTISRNTKNTSETKDCVIDETFRSHRRIGRLWHPPIFWNCWCR